jgi:hypothetical protein
VQRRSLAVLGPLIIVGAGLGQIYVHHARQEREAAQLAAEQERNRERERERAELEAKLPARREPDADRPHHPFPPQHEEELRRIREENHREAERAARAAEAARK